jgi:hypothetical protein
MVRRRVRERCGQVARLAIEALQGELDAAGGPEDARAKATLRYLIEIATAPRIELANFPRMHTAGP